MANESGRFVPVFGGPGPGDSCWEDIVVITGRAKRHALCLRCCGTTHGCAAHLREASLARYREVTEGQIEASGAPPEIKAHARAMMEKLLTEARNA